MYSQFTWEEEENVGYERVNQNSNTYLNVSSAGKICAVCAVCDHVRSLECSK